MLWQCLSNGRNDASVCLNFTTHWADAIEPDTWRKRVPNTRTSYLIRSGKCFLPICTVTASMILRHCVASSSRIAKSPVLASPWLARLIVLDDLATILFITSTLDSVDGCRYSACRHDDSRDERRTLSDSMVSWSGTSSDMIRCRLSASTLKCGTIVHSSEHTIC